MSEPVVVPPAPRPPSPPSFRRIIGIIIMLLGIGMTVVSGLCTTAFMIGDLTGNTSGGELDLSGVEFIVGGPFILVGALMWWGGARLKRPPVRHDPNVFGDPPPPPSTTT